MHFKISDESEKLGSRVFANKIYVPYLESPMLKVRMNFFEEWGMWAQNFGITRIRNKFWLAGGFSNNKELMQYPGYVMLWCGLRLL